MKERHISLSIPESFNSSSDDSDRQDDQDSEDDSSIQDSSPLATAQYWDGDDNSTVPTSDVSITDDDEDTKDSNEDEDDDDHSQDEDNEDDIGFPDVKSYFDTMKPVVKGGVTAATIQLKCTKTTSAPVSIDFRSKSVEWALYPHELDVTKVYELVIGISAKYLRIVDIEEVVFTVNGVEEVR
ncbi:hypothetical protein BGX33_000531 [Mortierella sp. NVP41]|nr:hypothetical protein BGX33_000531 [Mortierella sp. NVP41]